MTTQEAQELLNLMYPPQRVSTFNINANGNLTSQEKEELLQIIVDFEEQDEHYDYESAIQLIAGIAKRFITPATKVNGKTVPIKPQALPLLIQQVLFYIAVAGKLYKLYSQADIITMLKSNGLKIGQIYSKMPFEPSYYLSCSGYCARYKSLPDELFSQPQILFPYNGQKDKHLGIAIKNLVYQAGKFGRFVDVFGGTASATLAFPHRGYTDYVYNELNKDMYNLNHIIGSVYYQDLMNELVSLKKALLCEELWLDNPERPNPVDFDTEMYVYYNRHFNQTDIYKFRNAETFVEFDNVVKFVKQVINDIQYLSANFIFTYANAEYTKQQLLDKFASLNNDADYFMSYLYEHDFYYKLSECLPFVKLRASRIDEVNGVDPYVTFLQDAKLREMQVRFYQYYCYFSNVLDTSEVQKYLDNQSSDVSLGVVNSLKDAVSPVRRALAYIFIMSLTTMNNIGISAVNRMAVTNGKTQDYSWKHFLYPTQKQSNAQPEQSEAIEVLHKIFKDVTLLNEDFKGVIIPSNNKETLYYVDSPYLGTVDYNETSSTSDEAVDSFSVDDMHDLIDLLGIAAESGDKFIFSCRACLSGKASRASRTDDKPVDLILVKNVFEKFKERFLDKGMPLWVVTICENSNKDFFEDIVANRGVAEIMIYNYEVQPFEADTRFNSTKNAKYEFYTYEDFITKLLPVLKTI